MSVATCQGLSVADMIDDWFDGIVALIGAPLPALGVTLDDVQRPRTVVQLGLPPNRIDILTTISGISSFDAAWADRVEHVVRGRAVPFLGRATLVKNKRASGRRKDLADIEALGEDTSGES